MFTLLEFIFQGFFEWVYSLILEIWNYFSSSLLDIMSLDFAYIKTHIPVVADISQIILAVGWALLLGNLVFQAMRSMAAGLGFEGEDPKLLFARTFVFAFLLLASPQICELVLTMTSSVITLLDAPSAINVHLVDSSVFGVLGASWILVIIFDIITMFMVLSLLLEVAERYMVLAMLTIMAPLAFAMGGSKSTSEIFTGWCRMFGSMCFLMATNIVFFKMLLSVVSAVPSFPDVFSWMVLIISIVKVAKKADEIITRIGLNPAITGNRSTLPGMLAYTVFRTALSMATKGAASGISGAMGFAGKGAAGAGRSAAGAAFKGAGRGAGAAAGMGGAAQQAASGGPRYGGGRQQTQQTNSQQEHTRQGQQSTSQTQSQQQTATQERTTDRTGPSGAFRPGRPSRKTSVQPGTHRAPGYVTPPDGSGSKASSEEKRTSQSTSSGSTTRGGGFSKDTARGGGFSGSSRGGGFSDGPRGGGFSQGTTQSGSTSTATSGDATRRSGFGGTSRGGGFSDGPRGGGFGGAGTTKETSRSGGTFGGRPSGTTRGGGFGDSSRGGGFPQSITQSSSASTAASSDTTKRSGFGSTSRGGGFGGAGAAKETSRGGGTFGGRTSGTTDGGFGGSFSKTTQKTEVSQSGTAGTGTRSTQRPAGSESRHGRNIPPATSTPTPGAQRSGPVPQEQRRISSTDKSPVKSGASASHPDAAGTVTRSTQRPAGSEPRHSRNVPPATSTPTSGTQRSGPVQQEQRQVPGKDKPPVKSGASGPRPGTAGTGTGHRTPPGQKLSGGPTSKPMRQTKRGGPTSV